ncbi:MAG: DNA repair protein RadA [candidate division Zixibacteria bacterium]|nr:DNA repair protein RadA [candidate division Zixibacteria bacterium]
MTRKSAKTVFECESCGYRSPKWLGKCPSCGGWDTFTEQKALSEGPSRLKIASGKSFVEPLSEIRTEGYLRQKTGFSELDRTLGGGMVPGSVNLIGGEPGIGKSTILLQIAGNLSLNNITTFYVTGEESKAQIKSRADRLKISQESISITTETDISTVLGEIDRAKPTLVVIDSIQTMYEPEIGSYPGTVGQIRESAAACIEYAKKNDTIFILSGHITKEGVIAGPKVLEHMVDTVLYFEGDKDFLYRIIRGVKNRFGAAGEIGVFEMRSDGLAEVEDPSGVFLSSDEERTGSVVMPMMEGSRPFLIEVQALAVPSGYSVSQKVSVGFDSKKLSLISAICEKKANLHLGGMDIFVKILGGVKAEEAAVDLPVAMALFSSVHDLKMSPNMAVFGELGLSGEVRGASNPERRVAEALRMGFDKILLPEPNKAHINNLGGVEIIGVRHIQRAFEAISSL